MKKINKIWIEEHTRKDGTKFFTGHIRQGNWIFSEIKDLVSGYMDTDFYLVNSSFSIATAHQFSNIEDAKTILNSSVEVLKNKLKLEEDKKVVKSRKIVFW